MKKIIITTEFKRTLDGKTCRVIATFPKGFLRSKGLEGNTISKTVPDTILPSREINTMAVNSILTNVGIPGYVSYSTKSTHTNGYVFELQTGGYTPGPWTVLQDARGAWIFSGTAINENRIASIEKNMSSNAALISAAPDLLMGLEAIAEHLLKGKKLQQGDALHMAMFALIERAGGKFNKSGDRV